MGRFLFLCAVVELSCGAASPDFLSAGSHDRKLSHSYSHIACPAGYIDHTQGKGKNWQCASHCPGEFAWADCLCGCACVLPTECVASTPEDPCVTEGELKNNIKDSACSGPVSAENQPPSQPLFAYLPQPTPHPAAQRLIQATTSAPVDSASESVWLWVSAGCVLMFGSIAVLTCFRCWVSMMAKVEEPSTPSTPSVYPSAVPSFACFRGSAKVWPLPEVPALPQMASVRAQPQPAKPAWFDVESGSVSDNTSSRRPSNASTAAPSSRQSSRASSPRPEPRQASESIEAAGATFSNARCVSPRPTNSGLVDARSSLHLHPERPATSSRASSSDGSRPSSSRSPSPRPRVGHTESTASVAATETRRASRGTSTLRAPSAPGRLGSAGANHSSIETRCSPGSARSASRSSVRSRSPIQHPSQMAQYSIRVTPCSPDASQQTAHTEPRSASR